MAEQVGPSGRRPARTLQEALVRTLRHEMGDFLQKVYASVAILKDRLPPEKELEQGVLARLWSRSETCKRVLDTAHDFICDVSLDCHPVDLAQVAERAAAQAHERFPKVEVVVKTSGKSQVTADARRAAQVAEILLTNACEAAKTHVTMHVAGSSKTGEVGWTIVDDGPGMAAELTDNLFEPFFTTRAGHSGLGLALARKLVTLHGGRLNVGNQPEGGFQAQVTWPPEAVSGG